MRSLKQIIKPHHEIANHILALVIGLLFGLLGTFSDTKIESLIGQAGFSIGIGLFIGLYMALSSANSEDGKPKDFALLGLFYAIRIAISCFVVMFVASAIR